PLAPQQFQVEYFVKVFAYLDEPNKESGNGQEKGRPQAGQTKAVNGSEDVEFREEALRFMGNRTSRSPPFPGWRSRPSIFPAPRTSRSISGTGPRHSPPVVPSPCDRRIEIASPQRPR